MAAEVDLHNGPARRPAAPRLGEKLFQRGPLGWFHRLAPARLTSRIIIINFIGLLILLAGILYFNQLRQSLIDAQRQSLMTQGRIIASAIAASATVDTGQITVDAERLIEQQFGEDAGFDLNDIRDLEYPINPEQAGPVLRRLVKPTGNRARIYDEEGLLVVDSQYFYGPGILRADLPPLQTGRSNFLLAWWHSFADWIFSADYPLAREYGLTNGKEFPEVTAALNGAHVSVLRVNEEKEVIVTVAVPIQRLRAVLGTLVLSTTGGEIDDVLRDERRIVLLTFAIAAIVAILLSVALASHIAEPIRRLSRAAESVSRGVKNRAKIPNFTYRRDEIGHLSGTLRNMTEALYNRIDAIEAFAADVSHELKNPLTSLRSAVETLQHAKTDDQRNRLVEIVTDDVKRLNRLITDISDASRLDAELVRAKAEPVDIRLLLETVVDLTNETHASSDWKVDFSVMSNASNSDQKKAFQVLGHENRLGQVVRNLIDNACSFTAPGTTVYVQLRRLPEHVEFTIEDSGPGIPAENLNKVFQRFYTDRPAGSFGKNSGLGLSISKQIIEAYNGNVEAENRLGTSQPNGEPQVLGARFRVRLPTLDAAIRLKNLT